ncbi:IS3 family transposase [Listeria seeligeri]|uniref:IS3 family transposase n=1 Tax=Listeria seeligeri TaxID=1640 RepID=UPI00396F5588
MSCLVKKEEVYVTTYPDFEKANRALLSYMEGFYNHNRIHSSTNYLTPQDLADQEKANLA